MPQIIEVPSIGPVEFPDDMSDDQIASAIQANMSPTPTPQAAAPSAPTAEDRMRRVAGLGVRAAGPIGAGALVGGAIGSVVPGVGTALGATAGAGAATLTQLIDKMTGRNITDTFLDSIGVPRADTPVEKFATDVTGSMAGGAGILNLGRTMAAQVPGQIAQTTGQRVAESLTQLPGRQIAAAGTSAAASNLAGQAGAGPVGQFVAGLVGGMAPFAGSMVRAPIRPEQARQQEISSNLMNRGYVLPPSQSAPGPINNVMTGSISGKAPTERLASLKNQAITDAMVKRDLGIPPEQAITPQILKTIRDQAGRAYDAVASAGKFSADDQFKADLSRLTQTQRLFSSEVPTLANKDILNVSKSFAKRNDFSGQTLVEATKDLRSKATSAFKSGDTTAGRFYRQMSDSIEDLMERNLQASGRTDLIPDFRSARQTIARAHSVESALTDAGNVSARDLANQLSRGTPLSGGMREAARLGENFPGSAQLPEQAGRFPGVSMTDAFTSVLLGSGGAMASQSPYGALAAAIPFVRPFAREAILSRPYQSLMATPPAVNLTRPQAATMGIMSTLYPNADNIPPMTGILQGESPLVQKIPR